MDFESTRTVFSRIQKLEPENVSKIVGYLLLRDNGEREMNELAVCPDSLIISLINKAKSELGLASKPQISTQIPQNSFNSDLPLPFTPFSLSTSRPFSSPATFAPPYWEHQPGTDQQALLNLDLVSPEEYRFQNQAHSLGLDDQLEPVNPLGAELQNEYFYQEPTLASLSARTSRRTSSMPEIPSKLCVYFQRGFCKHGNNCRFFHGQHGLDHFLTGFSTSPTESLGDDHMISSGTLERLEMELLQLLRAKRTPISIASLPQLYYERFGKTLQAEGYLTESQRHGKAGYSLTKLLARLKNSIRLIDRPHGQHAVVLAEDAAKYTEYRSDRNDPGAIVAGSRQIYLTFPAESTFTEEDVSNYFRTFGPVQDVRIPCQQKRMFGFVTFMYPETVKMILNKGNPHFVCGARVLVKPYREKSRLVDRKYPEKIDHPVYYSPHFLDMEPEYQSVPGIWDDARLIRKQLREEQEHAIELERRRLSEFQMASKPLSHNYFGYPMDDFKLSEACTDQNGFPSTDRFGYLLDVLNSDSASDDKTRHASGNYSDQESSQGLNLPESPFASPITNSISTVI
ncbi:zinc finger CCCH domain-containing protein 18 isoform X2 [Amborella trichopoda]|uniref:zinc finger CCCH domain-containing protein 18 isoform X2 n=1 Tax=Amborella trichopoda TaxID=13333 RepID=UPI0005D3D6F0|nr:zinc finger CCCH domain-containing protein 18 isoform X2 [Amborella trichopoda]|eukprot:XP_011620931.1 zinc finger CCCH domain-containing protein 18 isoform X2 [Amborella trichopoda]